MKLNDAYKVEEVYIKITKCLQLTLSTVPNAMKKRQIRRTLKVRTRSRRPRPRNLSDTASSMLDRKAKQNPHTYDTNDLLEGLSDTGVVVHCFTAWRSHQKKSFPVI